MRTKPLRLTPAGLVLVPLAVLSIVFGLIIMVVIASDRIQFLSFGSLLISAALVYAATQDTGFPALPLAIASLFVIVNGALTQVIAAARLLMDMGRDDLLSTPALFGRVNGTTHTPIIATLASLGVILVLALFVPLGTLASGTSLAILFVFTAVNAALWKLKSESQPEDVPNMWKLVPVLGVVTCALAIVGQVVLWTTGIGG